ncbi:FG-GAP-like repeat-containing protein [Hymenobacter sp. GOD-10R]|uniref:FG-GAP-like repeat-containing protein n=1 Tax=Hymenobacter sp. GOD-10R TaxID=3093922 RepID=UPI002D78A20E|nr:FG-GAP-like repeat-containing protein [Hymenobacter sp. GOD-10R]WRQ27028.1 FG-GAP-like repeat-containing protein [Hymenobacter sp. GOD-10R]
MMTTSTLPQRPAALARLVAPIKASLLLLLTVGSVQAQAPLVTSLTPTRNARSAPRTTNVAATFNQTLSNTPATQQALRVFGQQAGKKAGTATVSGNTLTFDPSTNFQPGETVYATITGAARSSGGVAAAPHVFQFTTTTAAAPATFAPARLATLGFYPNEVKFGDLNGDGALDILAASSNSNVAIRLNNGNGVFGTTQTVAVSAEARVLATADIDGDGDLDFLTCNNVSGTTPVSVRLNNGDATFSSAQSVQPGGAVLSMTLGDVDGDGDQDLLIGKNATVAVRFNNGSGLFSGDQEVSVDAFYTEAVALGDVDSDGDLDLLTANDSRGTVSVRLNNGLGIFTGGSEVTVGGQLFDVTTGDVDADGDLDIVAASQSLGKVSVRLNNGNGTFAGGQDLVVGPNPYTVELGDLDGDGDLDLATGRTSGGVGVSLNNGSGTFAPAQTLTPVSYARPLTLGDADNDGDLDILTGNDNSTSYGLNLFLNQPAPSITSVTPNTTSAGVSVTIIGNNLLGANGVTFSGTEAPSFVANSNTQLTVTVPNGIASGPLVVTSVLGNSNSVPFTISSILGVTSVTPARNSNAAPLRGPVTVTLRVPFNNSPATLGALKVFSQQAGGKKAGTTSVNSTALSFTPTVPFKAGETIYATLTGQAESGPGAEITPHVFQFTTATSPSSGVFGGGSEVAVGGNPFASSRGLATGDVDGDGDLDLVTSNGLTNTVSVRLNNGAGAFSGTQEVAVGNIPLNVALGDLDNDGDLDMLAVNQGTAASNFAGSVSIRLNNGSGIFSGSQEVLVGQAPYDVTLGDVDGDGDLDFVCPKANAAASVRLNDGSSTFSSGSEVALGSLSYTAALADIDNDGDLDLLAPSYGGSTLSVRLNNGNGIFTGTQIVSAGGSPNGFAVGDIDGDGDVDLLVTSFLEFRGVDIRFNDGAGKFSSTQRLPLPNGATSLALSDVDGDGDLDLLASNYRTLMSASICLNNGLGSFSISQQVALAAGAQGLAVGDLDGDGDTDFLARSDIGSNVSVRLNGNTTLLPTAFSPTRNARSAPRNTDVSVTFNQALTNNAATQGALKVFGQQSGLKASAVAVSGNTLTLNPTTDFKPGEKVFATLTTAAQSSSGSLTNPQVYEFTAATAPSPGTFLGGSDIAGAGNIAVGDLDGDGDLDYVTLAGGVRYNDGTGRYVTGQLSGTLGAARNVALADLDGDGDLDMLLSANNGRGFVNVRFNNGTGVFSGNQVVQVGAEPYGLAAADVDGDGDLDLLTANYSSASVSVRLNDGAGTFGGGSEVSVGTQPNSLAIGDIDSDGDLDFIVQNSNTTTVSIRRNDGRGNFSGTETLSTGFNPSSMVLGDVDGDGDLDLLTANFNNYEGNRTVNGDVRVSKNDGFGTFSNAQKVMLGGSPTDVTLGDVDGDGDLDLVTSNGGNGSGTTASIRLNDGTGTFSGTQEVTVSTGANNVALADVDNDGDLDLLTSGISSTSVRLNTAPLAITAVSPGRNAPAAPRTTPVAVTFNQPLSTDPAAQNALRVFSAQAGGRKTGTATVSGNTLRFAPNGTFKPGETIFATATTSVRGANNQILPKPQVFQFTAATAPSNVNFSSGSDPSVGATPQSVATGDVDGDGDLDLLTTTNNAIGYVRVRLNNGAGAFSGGSEVYVGNNPYQLVLGDVDGDGDLDLATALSGAGGAGGAVRVIRNKGAGIFSNNDIQTVSVGPNAHAVAFGDVDGDGDLDLLVANYTVVGNTTNSTVSVRLNDGTGEFNSGSEVNVGTRPVSLALGDVDNDGDLDFLTANSNSTTISLRLNDGTGTFSGTTEINTAYNPEVVTLGDVDNDGDLDLIAAHVVSRVVVVRLNDGAGNFSGTVPLVLGLSAPYGLALGDADGDGDLDMFVANSGTNTVSVRLNNGAGTFGGSLQVPVGSNPTSVVLGDLDGNGTLDFITANKDANTASVRLNSPVAAKVLAAAPAKLLEQVELYPNPAHELVQLVLPTELVQQAVQLSLVNALGQVVLEQQLTAQQTALELKLGRLPQGVYSVQLRTAAGLVTKRLVIE